MNRVIQMGRVTKNPDVRTSTGGDSIARYTLAVDRIKEGADFISCVTFGKNAEFAEKYLKKGTKILVEGRLQAGSYEKNGQRIYTTDVIVERHEFCESKKSDGFESINAPVSVDDIPDFDDLPFE